MTALRAVPDDTEGRRYSTQEACELAGITYRCLDFWTRAGLLGDPQLVGSGHSRTYTFDEVELLRLVKPLLDAGFTLRAAFDIARQAITTGVYRVVLADIYELSLTVRPTIEGDPTA